MEITLYLHDKDIASRNKAEILGTFKDALIGQLFLQAKGEIDQRYHDGLVSAAEYSRFLAMAADTAHETVSQILDQ